MSIAFDRILYDVLHGTALFGQLLAEQDIVLMSLSQHVLLRKLL